MDSVRPQYTYSETFNSITLKGESCGAGGYSKICPEDLVSYLHKSITKYSNCEDTLCMKPNRFAEFKQFAEELLTEKYYRVNIGIDNLSLNKKDVNIALSMYLEVPYSSAFSEEHHCKFRKASVNEEMKVTCERTRESCRSLGTCFSSTKETTQYDFTASRLTDYLKVGTGLASTIFFTYKAYQETRKIFEESQKPALESKAAKESMTIPSEHNKSAPKASSWRAMAYTVAAVGSGIFSAYAFQDL